MTDKTYSIKLTATAQGVDDTLKRVGAGARSAAGGLADLDKAAASAGLKLKQAAAAVQGTFGAATAKLAGEADRAASAMGKLDSAAERSARTMRDAASQSGAFGVSIRDLIRYATGLTAGTFGVHAIINFTGALIDAQKQIDSMRTGLAFALDAGPAKLGAELEYVRGVADRLGQSLPVLAKGYTMIAASAKGTTLEGRATRDIFEAMAMAGTVFSLSAADMTGALLAVRQMMSKGVVNAEELRGQLGERLPGAYEIAARSMGKTTAEFGKMLENGEVLASDFLPRFASQLRTELGDSAEAAADKMQASTNRMQSAWFRFKVAVDESGVGEAIKASIDIGTEALDAFSLGVERARENNGSFVRQMQAGLASKYINDINSISKALSGNALFTPQGAADQARQAQAAAQAAQIEDMRQQAAALARANKTVSASFVELQNRLSGNKAGFFGDLKTLHAEYAKGTIKLADYRSAVEKLIASDTALGKAQAKSSSGGGSGAAKALAALKAEVDARVKLTEDGARRERDALAIRYQDGELSAADYYARDVALQKQAIDAKLAELERERAATAAGSADRFRIESQIVIAQRDRLQAAVEGSRLAQRAEDDYRVSLEQTRLKLAEVQGTATYEQRRDAARERQAPELARMPEQNRAVALELIDTTAAQEQLRAYEQEAAATFERLRLAEQMLNQDQAAGRVTGAEASRLLNAARAEQIPVLEAIGERMRALQAAAGDAFGPAQVNAVLQFKTDLEGLKDAANAGLGAFKSGATQGFTDLLTDLTDKSKSAGDAFEDFGQRIFDTINNIVMQQLGERLAKSLFDGLGMGAGGSAQSAGGGIGGALSTGLGGFFRKLLGYADGGLISGPGTGTSDSVLMRGSRGEYMVRAAAVQHVGVGFMDWINSLGSGSAHAPRMLAGMPAFAGGGMIDAAPMQASGAAPSIAMNVYANDARSFERNQSQIAASMARLMRRANERDL